MVFLDLWLDKSEVVDVWDLTEWYLVGLEPVILTNLGTAIDYFY